MEKSYLFVPGNTPDKIKKAFNSNADAIIIDLEDAVPLNEKDSARDDISNILDSEQLHKGNKKTYIRVNDVNAEFFNDDIKFLKQYNDIGIMLPKVESSEDIKHITSVISRELIPLIESAKGVMSSFEIATSSNLINRLAFGSADYCLDIGIKLTKEGTELFYPRNQLVISSRAANIASPIDGVHTDLYNRVGLEEEVNHTKKLGIFSKLCLHPVQVDTVNEILLPTVEEIEWATKIVEKYLESKEKNVITLRVDGEIIDYPIYKQAQRILNNVH